MNETAPDQDGQRYLLRAQIPLRALLIASGSEVVGAILLVAWGALDLSVVLAVLGGLLLAFGSAALLAAVLTFGRLAQTVLVSPAGVTLSRRSRTTTVDWGRVKQVTRQGSRLLLQTDGDSEPAMVIVNPGGGAERTFVALTDAIRVALDDNRGYRPLD